VATSDDVNLWRNADHAINYLEHRGLIPRRNEAYEVLLEILPPQVERVLDLGTGDGLTLERVLDARPGATGVGVDFQDEMLVRARDRFAGRPDAAIAKHDLDLPLPSGLGDFDVIVSSFAIHHVVPERQRVLYGEIFDRLRPGGCFANVEHVDSSTPARHVEFLYAIGSSPERDDPSNKLVPVATHLDWLRGSGFADAECLWRWRELAVLSGNKPA
jgi:tRNA (cmo5U34)-methyltransferase